MARWAIAAYWQRGSQEHSRQASRDAVELAEQAGDSEALGTALLLAAVQLLEAQTIFNPAPSRIVGQAVLQQQGVLTAVAPNLVEGREFNNPQAVALDTSVTPPILYVADFGNNRIVRTDDMQGTNWTTYSGGNDPLKVPRAVCIH